MSTEGRPGITVREAGPADAAAIARVHVDSWRTTYCGIVPDDYLAQLSYAERERRWQSDLINAESGQSAYFVYVAEDESGQIVGFASGGPERIGDPVYTGELYAIYILAAHQGNGMGRRLVQSLAARLVQAGMRSMLVWVLADNPSRHFYEALAGEPVRQQPIEIGGVMLDEVAYGWPDTSLLVRLVEGQRR